MEYTVDGLLPFTEYRTELSISNMYTLRRHYRDTLFSIGKRFITREGGNCIAEIYCRRKISPTQLPLYCNAFHGKLAEIFSWRKSPAMQYLMLLDYRHNLHLHLILCSS